MRLKRPDPLKGTATEQAEQLRRYLFALVNELEIKVDEMERKQKKLDERLKEVEKK